MKKTLLAGAAALALVLGMSAGAWAHDIDVTGDIIDDVIGHDAFSHDNTVSTNVLAQVVSAVTDHDPITDGKNAKIVIEDHAFTHALGVFNVVVTTGTNVAQAAQISIAASARFNFDD